MIFVDTSAILPLLNSDDPDHAVANDALRRHIQTARFITHSYVVVETMALLQHRFGMRVVRAFVDRLLPRLEVIWVDRVRHDRAMDVLIEGSGRRISLVDRVSFEVMHEVGCRTVFAFDRDFAREGFTLLD